MDAKELTWYLSFDNTRLNASFKEIIFSIESKNGFPGNEYSAYIDGKMLTNISGTDSGSMLTSLFREFTNFMNKLHSKPRDEAIEFLTKIGVNVVSEHEEAVLQSYGILGKELPNNEGAACFEVIEDEDF